MAKQLRNVTALLKLIAKERHQIWFRIMWVNLEFNGEQKGFVKTKSLENFKASNIWKSVGNDYIFRIQGQVND